MSNRCIIFSLCTYFFVNSAIAVPILSEPNDIIAVQTNTVDIANTKDGSILECKVVNHHLQNCESKQITGIKSPYRIAVVNREDNSKRLYITKKGTNTIYSLVTDIEGHIQNNSLLEKTSLPKSEPEGTIFHIAPVVHNVNVPPNKQRFYVSGNPGLIEMAGQFIYADLSANKAKITRPQSNFTDLPSLQRYISLPAFFVNSNGSSNTEDIVGVGNISGNNTIDTQLYPFVGTIRADNSNLVTEKNQGGLEATTDSSVASDVSSIAEVNGKYWITYKSSRKFTRYDDFPSAKADSDKYVAPNDANVSLKQVISSQNGRSETNTFATFADGNKIGVCNGADNFVCTDAFRYIGLNTYLNNETAPDKEALTINSHFNSGRLVFRNLNYSPIDASEIVKNINIPNRLKEAISGSCEEKYDFPSNNHSSNFGLDACILDFDFRKMTNAVPIKESFDVGFAVRGPFGYVTTKIRINVDLPSSTPQLYFQQNDRIINQLNVNSGENSELEIVYIGRQDQDLLAANLSFFDGHAVSKTARSYFSTSECIRTPTLGKQWQFKNSCKLNYSIPAGAQDKNFKIIINHSETQPNLSPDSILNVRVSASAKVVPHFAADTSPNEFLNLQGITLQPGESEVIQYTNIGSDTSRNFKLSYFDTPLTQYLSGNCTTGIDLAPMMSCTLNIDIPLDASLAGQFLISNQGDNDATDQFFVTIGRRSFNGQLLIRDSNYVNSEGYALTPDELDFTNQSTGEIIITNQTSSDIPDLTISLPHLQITPTSQEQDSGTNGSFFNFDETTSGIPSCLSSGVLGSTSSIKLLRRAKCAIRYHATSETNITSKNAKIEIGYFNNTVRRTKKIHFTNQPPISFENNSTNLPDHQISIDASTPVRKLTIKNNVGHDINRLNIEVPQDIAQVVDTSNCQHTRLHPNETCQITLRLDDRNPRIGKHIITISADNLTRGNFNLFINEALTDKVQVDNRGGYIMNVGYINQHLNTNGDDPSCDAKTGCYGNTETGIFTNPNNRNINDVSKRDINLYIIAGYTRTLKSCDGGKIVCTRATVNPYCRYYSDGTDAQNTQNQCVKVNP